MSLPTLALLLLVFCAISGGWFVLVYNNSLATLSAKLVTNSGTPTPGSLIFALFTAPGSVANTDTLGGMTELTALQATGYARQTVAGTAWTLSSPSGGVVTATGPAVTFTFTASTSPTIVGAMVLDPTGTILLWDGILDTAFAVPVGGGSLTLNPVLTFKTC